MKNLAETIRHLPRSLLALAGVATLIPAELFALDVITVTAQRREQNLQKVPVAITAISGEELEAKQISDVLDLQAYAPNVFVSNGTGTANSARIFFRGVGEDESRGAIDPAVGIYVDGIYLGRTVGSLMDVVDLERIEVLRGPQGTLYGRNTNGGAIKLVSKRPEDETNFDLAVGTGTDARVNVRGTANVAFTDQTALRVTGLVKQRDGFHDINPTGDFAGQNREVGEEDVLSFRASLLQKFNEDWSALFAFDLTKDDSDPVPSSIIDESDDPSVATDVDGNIFTVEPAAGVLCDAMTPVTFQPIGCFTGHSSEIDILGLSANVKGDIAGYDFTSLTGYRSMEDDLATHIGFTFFQETDQDQFSQEFTVGSNYDGPFNFVSGFYFYDESVQLDSTFVFPFRVEVDTQSFALFFQGTYEFFDRMRLTGGLRYTDEDRDFRGTAFNFDPDEIRDVSISSENTTFTLKLDYDFTDAILGYVSLASGFKSPGFSPDCFSTAACFLPVNEEDLLSFEFGVRSDLLDDKLRLNATFFYNTYDDLQISATVPGLGFTRSNAAEATIQGIEIESVLTPIDGLEFFGNLSWLDPEYDSLSLAQAGTLTNDGASCPGGVVTIECGESLELKNAPEFKGTIGVLYTFPLSLGIDGELTLGGDVAYEDESFALVANPPGSKVDPSAIVNLRARYAPTDGPWWVTVWGKNIGDREYFRATTGTNNVYASPPATWGVDFGISFE